MGCFLIHSFLAIHLPTSQKPDGERGEIARSVGPTRGARGPPAPSLAFRLACVGVEAGSLDGGIFPSIF